MKASIQFSKVEKPKYIPKVNDIIRHIDSDKIGIIVTMADTSALITWLYSQAGLQRGQEWLPKEKLDKFEYKLILEND